MAEQVLDDTLYEGKSALNVDENLTGNIDERDRLHAAKQILCGLAVLYLITAGLFIYNPNQGNVLLEICKTVLPPLATLIIAFYFKDKNN